MSRSILIEKMVNDGQLNKYLFKYRSLSKNTEDYKHTIEIFKNMELWFSAPKAFNDPFDCKLVPTVSSKEDFAHTIASRQMMTSGYDISLVENYIKQAPDLQGKINQALSNVMNKCGILALSKRKDDILMWSHYADCHRGICLEFDITQDYDFFTYPICMINKADYPLIDLATNEMEEFVAKMLKTKFLEWEYEEEVRIYKRRYGTYPFNPQSLKNIYFGCKAEKSTIKEVYNTIHSIQELSHVGFYMAKENEKAYKLDFEQMQFC